MMSGLSLGIGGGPLRLATSSKGRMGSSDGREGKGTACGFSTLFVFSHVSERDTGCRWLGLHSKEQLIHDKSAREGIW